MDEILCASAIADGKFNLPSEQVGNVGRFTTLYASTRLLFGDLLA